MDKEIDCVTIFQISDFVKTKWYILLGSAATVIITFIICFKKIKGKFTCLLRVFVI